MIVSRNSTEKHLGEIFTTNTTWSKVRSSDLRLIKSEKSTRPELVTEIQTLVNKLAEIANVRRVRAIAKRFPDIHWIDFELELPPDTDLSDEVWDQVQDLVIDCEWKLRHDSGEKWYFRGQVVDLLSSLRDPNEVIADSDNRQRIEVGVRTWSSPPLKLITYTPD